MTAAAPDRTRLDGGQDRALAAQLVITESPGGIGTPEIWADADALDFITSGGMKSWPPGTVIGFKGILGAPDVVYEITCRRWSQDNGGRPYYVLKWPD